MFRHYMFTTEVRQTTCFKAVSYLMHLPNMTGQQRMINPPWYLILPLLLFKKSVFALLLFCIFFLTFDFLHCTFSPHVIDFFNIDKKNFS